MAELPKAVTVEIVRDKKAQLLDDLITQITTVIFFSIALILIGVEPISEVLLALGVWIAVDTAMYFVRKRKIDKRNESGS